ncbi:MAG: ATPase, T2SS/T4P/T4SS family [Neisseriaceae bacterium]
MHRIDKIYSQPELGHFRDVLQRTGLLELLKDEELSDICINEYGFLHLKDVRGNWQKLANSSIDSKNCTALKNFLLHFNNKFMTADNPSEAISLPSGERCHIIGEPVAEKGHVLFAIRKYTDVRFTLEDYDRSGRFSEIIDTSPAVDFSRLNQEQKALWQYKSERDFIGFFRAAVKYRLNIAIAGSMGSGKTVFHKTLLDLVNPQLRIALIQTNKDVVMPDHPNHFHLFYAENDRDKPSQLLKDCLRLAIDSPMIAEVRGGEAWTLLEMMNIGHSGLMFTIHSNSAFKTLARFTVCCKDNAVCLSMNEQSFLIR